MKSDKKQTEPAPLSKEDREHLAEVAKYCVGKDLFPEATADAKRLLAQVVSIGGVKK